MCGQERKCYPIPIHLMYLCKIRKKSSRWGLRRRELFLLLLLKWFCVCVCVSMLRCVHVSVCECVNACMWECIWVCVCVSMWECVCVCVGACIFWTRSPKSVQSCLSGLRSDIPLGWELTSITYHFTTVSRRRTETAVEIIDRIGK